MTGEPMTEPVIQVFLGTKAQYIKTAPLLRLMDAQGVPYRLIDSGQHGSLSVGLRQELGVREPDHVLGDARDVDTIWQAVLWAIRIAALVLRPAHLRREVFVGAGGRGRGICVVHGDTPSTLLATFLARRIGLPVAHLEAGLTSGRLWDPVPEEAIRRLVMRASSVLFAPDATAEAHLRATGVKGEIVAVSANTVVEAAAHALGDGAPAHDGKGPDDGPAPAVVTMHRVENLKHTGRVAGFVELVIEASASGPVTFVLHGPTEPVLAKLGHLDRLRAAGVVLTHLRPHGEFVAMLAAAPWVVTDGGSIQEECALLGVPTLLWRQRSERPDGIGHNIVVANHDLAVARAFLADPAAHRRPRALADVTPSAQILEVLRARVSAG